MVIILLTLTAALIVVHFGSRRPAKRRMPKIAAGLDLVVVKPDGSLWAVGRNDRGVTIGNGTTNDCPRLTRIGKDNDWVDVAGCDRTTLALKSRLRNTITKYKIPIRLPLSKTTDFVPRKIANLGPLPVAPQTR